MPCSQIYKSLERALFSAALSGEMHQAEHLASALLRMQRDKAEKAADIRQLSSPDEPCFIRDGRYRQRSYSATAIVSTYRAERFIAGRLEDLLAQTIGSDLEILVIDSASPEDESDIINEYQKLADNIRYIRTNHRETVYQAWNRGIMLAKGEFVTNANTDDRLRNDALEILSGSLRRNPDAGLAFANFYITEHANETFASNHAFSETNRPPYSLNALLENSITGSQPVWRRSMHDKHGFFDISLTSAADYDFFIKIASRNRFEQIHEPLGIVWVSPETFSGKGNLPALEFYMVRERYRHLLVATGRAEQLAPEETMLPEQPDQSAADYLQQQPEAAAVASPELLHRTGLVFESRGDWAEAWRWLQRAWYLKPESVRYRHAAERLLFINLIQIIRSIVCEKTWRSSFDQIMSVAAGFRMLGCLNSSAFFYLKAATEYPENIAGAANLQQTLHYLRGGIK